MWVSEFAPSQRQPTGYSVAGNTKALKCLSCSCWTNLLLTKCQNDVLKCFLRLFLLLQLALQLRHRVGEVKMASQILFWKVDSRGGKWKTQRDFRLKNASRISCCFNSSKIHIFNFVKAESRFSYNLPFLFVRIFSNFRNHGWSIMNEPWKAKNRWHQNNILSHHILSLCQVEKRSYRFAFPDGSPK